jgi:hypothetical protein
MEKEKTIDEAMGYVTAMKDVIKYLSEMTEFNPDKRYIDSVALIDFCREQSKKQSKQFTA